MMENGQAGIAELVDLLHNASLEEDQFDALNRLKASLFDPMVVDVLCATAVGNIDHRLRESLIQVLKNNPVPAYQYFIQNAIHSPDMNNRRWSLVNLALMECCKAKEAVLIGLQDHMRPVRLAAALNAGLYDDDAILKALDDVLSGQEETII